MADNWTGNTLNVSAGALSSTSMRYHELALQHWLNKIFKLRWGVPVPVVFSSPMDAFSLFSKLWSEASNPFAYLLDVKDECGNPVYQPHPQPVRYPIISVYRKGWKLRNYQNFSIHRMRWINYPTVSDAAELHDSGTHQQGTALTLCHLGDVTTSRFPMAFDYRFQIDHFCNRPDTQAFYTSQLFREFWRTGGLQMQTWIKVKYPGFGDKLVRLYVDGGIDNLTPEEPEEGKNVEFRTSFTVVLEGYDLDLDYKIYPALWSLMLRYGSAPPEALNSAFEFTGTVDLREQPESTIIDEKYATSVMPPEGTCSDYLQNLRLQRQQVHEIQFQSLIVTFPGPLAFPGYPPAAGVEAFGSLALTALPPPPPVVVDAGTWTDAGTSGGAFHVGSMDLYIYYESAPEVVTFGTGAYWPVVVDSGTFAESGSISAAFASGTYADTVVFVDAGTAFGTLAAVFHAGTYGSVAVDAGSYYESGSLSGGFTAGTYVALIIDGGTRTDTGTMSSGFYIGTHAL